MRQKNSPETIRHMTNAGLIATFPSLECFQKHKQPKEHSNVYVKKQLSSRVPGGLLLLVTKPCLFAESAAIDNCDVDVRFYSLNLDFLFVFLFVNYFA
jgi:hypothetical protein